jgi:arylsulfatase A-like enzyme
MNAWKPPNVIFFLIDDYGHTDVGYHNRNYENLLKTPVLDALAQGGVKLEKYYVQPICTPTRSTLMSGLYQIHTGLQHGVIHPEMPSGLPPTLPIISNHLAALGYRCHKVGYGIPCLLTDC